ncbi:hypothetical protein [Pseudophaeobacter sp. C1-32P7]|uniref:hypothetical protein n=1 Tax=Pseudophaeobacter sp. C1-32P7 TaxID=3098142 RepID=UPI0034D768EA
MNRYIENQLQKRVHTALGHGRLLSKEWREAGLVPQGAGRNAVLEVLDKLERREGLDDVNSEILSLIGLPIKTALDDIRERIRSADIEGETAAPGDRHQKLVKLINLSWRWCQFSEAKSELDDFRASVKLAETFLG